MRHKHWLAPDPGSALFHPWPTFDIEGEYVTRHVPGCRITHRLRFDSAWYATLQAALVWCANEHITWAQKVRGLDLLVDTADEKCGTLERRVLVDYCLERSLA